jgi:hypothetical protein
MNSALNPAVTDPNDALAASADQRLAHAYEQIARADEQLAHITERISKLDRAPVRDPAAVASRRPSRGRPVLRGLSGVLLAACIFAAAFISQSSYGVAAKQIVVRWAPQLASAFSSPQATAAQPASSAIQLAAAGPTPPQAAPPAQAAQQDAAPVPPMQEQLLQSMAHDLADLQDEIAQLKASQQQMASDNAKAFEDIKASQQQMAGLIALISDQNRRAAAPPPVAAARKPAPATAALASPHAAARPQAPVRLRPEGQ